ncbi:MAG: hypothetical protein UT25_C0007G0001, partial [Parcubacteria group bacterium GW2011_GWC1_39_12]
FRNFIFIFLAQFIYYLHFVSTFIIHFGWLFPRYRVAYIIFLILVPLHWLLLNGNCIFTVWEHYLRRKTNKNFNPAGKNFTAINLKKFFGINVTNRCVDVTSLSFIIGMIILQTFLLFK